MNNLMINTIALQNACEQDELLNDLFNYFFEERTNNYKETMRRQLRRQLSRYTGRKVGQSEMRKLFKKLEELGCGRYTQGKYARIEWSAPMLEIAKCAIGNQDVLTMQEEQYESTSVSYKDSTLTHRLNLRENFEFKIKLPPDVTSNECWRLGHFARALAHTPSSQSNDIRGFNLPIREGVEVEFRVPNNLSDVEAESLDNFFSSLPIEDDYYDSEKMRYQSDPL